MQVSKEYKLGLLIFVGCLLVFIGINTLKSGFNFGRSNEYYAVFDNAAGLQPGNEVQLNGVRIGEVLEVGLHPKSPTLILTKFTIENDELKIPISSEAWLISIDLVGTKCIDLRIDKSDSASTQLLVDGDTLNSKKELSLEDEIKLQLDPLRNKTEKLVGRVEDIIVEINELWDSSTSYTFEESVYEAREAVGTYMQLVNNLMDLINRETQMVANITGSFQYLKDSALQNMDDLNSMSQNVASVKEHMNATGMITEMANLNLTLEEMDALIIKVNNGEGTYGALTKSPEFKAKLDETKESMNILLKNISADPMKYVGFSLLGKKIDGVKLTKEEEDKLREWLSN